MCLAGMQGYGHQSWPVKLISQIDHYTALWCKHTSPAPWEGFGEYCIACREHEALSLVYILISDRVSCKLRPVRITESAIDTLQNSWNTLYFPVVACGGIRIITSRHTIVILQ